MVLLLTGHGLQSASWPNLSRQFQRAKKFVIPEAILVLTGRGCGVAWGDPQIEVAGPGARKIRCWFVMRDGTPAGLPDAGWYVYADSNRGWYVARIREVTGRRGEVFYAGPVLAGDQPWWKQHWLHGTMREGGTQPDRVWGALAMEGPALWAVAGKKHPLPSFDVRAGGISVRPH